ncbi:MAG: DUF1987 domain-containing protein [Cyclobacteriaceae bacterium]
MENLYINGTQHTPEVSFDENGVLLLRGRSIPENSLAFFQELYTWIENYGLNPNPSTEMIIQLDYFNTSSSKCILDLMKRLETISENGHKVFVKWYYDEDDEDMLESGEDYQDLIELNFEFIVLEEE